MPVDSNKEVNPNPAVETAKEEKTPNIIQQIKEIRENTVSKEEYEKVLKERDDAYSAMLEGKEIEQEESVDKVKRCKELQDELYGPEIDNSSMTNLDFFSKTLELRDLIIELGGDDPFLGRRAQGVTVSQNDYDRAQEIADKMKEMVEEAHGSPDAFNSIYQSTVVDVVKPKASVNKAYR